MLNTGEKRTGKWYNKSMGYLNIHLVFTFVTILVLSGWVISASPTFPKNKFFHLLKHIIRIVALVYFALVLVGFLSALKNFSHAQWPSLADKQHVAQNQKAIEQVFIEIFPQIFTCYTTGYLSDNCGEETLRAQLLEKTPNFIKEAGLEFVRAGADGRLEYIRTNPEIAVAASYPSETKNTEAVYNFLSGKSTSIPTQFGLADFMGLTNPWQNGNPPPYYDNYYLVPIYGQDGKLLGGLIRQTWLDEEADATIAMILPIMYPFILVGIIGSLLSGTITKEFFTSESMLFLLTPFATLGVYLLTLRLKWKKT